MKAGKLLASILVVSMALPMCACKPTSSKETDDPTGKTSEKKPTGTVTTDTEVPTDSSDGTEPSVTPSVPSTVSDESTDPLVIYGYDKDFEQVLADYLTDIEYEYVYVDPSSYTQELNNAIVLGEKKPDLFMMDADNLEAWATSENSLGIEQVGISRAELSDQFHFSRQTVRQALANLEQEGMINRIQGSGSYVKSAGAWDGGLQLSRSVTIISSYTDSYIFPRILQSMARVLQEAGYSTRIIFTGNRRETEKNILSDLIRSGSRDPLIAEPVTSGLPNPNLIYYRELRQRGIPILFFNTYYPDCDIPHVSLDDEAAGRMAAEHLIHLGHRRIGCVFKNDDGIPKL